MLENKNKKEVNMEPKSSNIDKQNKNIIHKKENKNMNDLLIHPHIKSSQIEKINNVNNIKEPNNKLNNIENNYEAIEFSFLDEKKPSKDKNEKKFDINYKINKDINENINNNNINSFNDQNLKIDSQVMDASTSVDGNMPCNFCKNKIKGIIFYCKDCSIFFCSICEKDIGKKHPHCYYIIRNKNQFKEICNIHNRINNKLKRLNNNNINKNIKVNGLDDNSIKEIISESSKLIGNSINYTLNSVINFFNTNQNHISKNNTNINNINNINNRNLQRNNNINNDNDIKSLIEKAKSQYNLEQINDDEIGKALKYCKGNIDKAVALLLLSYSL